MTDVNHNIIINNFNNNESVSYSLIILKGEINNNIDSNCNKDKKINFRVHNCDYNHNSTTNIYNRKFKHLISLKLGLNIIEIQYCCTFINFSLIYKPCDTKYCVVPVYIICQDHDGRFQSPENEDNSIESACERIFLGTRLIQSLLAEKFHEIGLSRKTFQIESDLNPSAPKCRVFHSQLSTESVRQMQQEELWCSFGRELMESKYGDDKFKYLAFISCTRYRGDKYSSNISTHDDIVRLTEAHAALGGGGLAIFGSACLHTWPTRVDNVVNCFENENVVDKTQFMDDSCYRGTLGGCFATTLGAVCHELCHTFDLGHTVEGIMGRGFDAINKEFTLSHSKNESKVLKMLSPEKQHCTVAFTPNINVKITHNSSTSNKKLTSFPSKHSVNINKFHDKIISCNKNGIHWTKSCLSMLYFHRWMNNSVDINHSLEFNSDDMIIKSSAGICVIEVRNESSGLVLQWWDFSNRPVNIFDVSKINIMHDEHNELTIIVVEDVAGNILKRKLS